MVCKSACCRNFSPKFFWQTDISGLKTLVWRVINVLEEYFVLGVVLLEEGMSWSLSLVNPLVFQYLPICSLCMVSFPPLAHPMLNMSPTGSKSISPKFCL